MNEDKHHILVIEDESMLLTSIKKMLESEGFRVTISDTAERALNILKDDTDLPDAIWLDYYLPDMNGLEFMSKLKADEKLSGVPVVVVSNSASPRKVNSMLGLGVKGYILKAEHRLEDIIKELEKVILESKKA